MDFPVSDVKSTLVIQTAFLGDAVLTTPLLSQLAGRGSVDIVVTPECVKLFANHPAVRQLFTYDKRGADGGIRKLLALARRLRAEKYDAVYLAQGSWRSVTLAVAARIQKRIGFSTSAGQFWLTQRIEFRRDLHHAARLLLLDGFQGREPTLDDLRPSLNPGTAERIAVDALLAAGNVRPDERLVALAPSSLWLTKRWPYYPWLARELASSARIVVVGSAADVPLANEILAFVPNAVDATGRLSPLGSAELIRRCAVIVSNDSAPLHIASAVGTPTVAIFGPTVPAFGFGPLAPRSITEGLETLQCRPCARIVPRECPLKHFRCMRDLPVERIAADVRSLLSSAITP